MGNQMVAKIHRGWRRCRSRVQRSTRNQMMGGSSWEGGVVRRGGGTVAMLEATVGRGIRWDHGGWGTIMVGGGRKAF
eukprot:751038-Hanusia_phi.AAC.10